MNDSTQNAIIRLLISTVLLLGLLGVAQSRNPNLFVSSFSDPVAFYTMVLATFTMLLAAVTFLVWQDTRQGLREQQAAMLEQNARTLEAIEIARDTAQATRDAVVLSTERAQHELRAYVNAAPVSVDMTALPNLPHLIEVKVEVKNYGVTPAYQIVNNIRCVIMKWPILSEEEISWPSPNNLGYSVKQVAPRQNLILAGTHGFPFYLESMQDGSLRVVILIVIKYNDIFEKERWIYSCGAVANSYEWLSAISCGQKPPELRFEGSLIGNRCD